MPTPTIALPTGLFGTTVYPYSITIGGLEVAPTLAELDSIEFADNGDDEPGDFFARLWDPTSALTITERSIVRVWEQDSDDQVFLGQVTKRTYDPTATGRWIDVEAKSISQMLDEVLVVSEKRPIESDRARVLYLWGKYARQPLSGDAQFVTETNAAIASDLLANMTLRQALRQTAGLAGSTTRLAIDPLGKPHWFAGNESNPAPFNINVANPPGGGSIAPTDLSVERDGTIVNRVWVRGQTEAISLFVQDDASVATYRPVEGYLDAPSADTTAKATAIARLYFGRVANPRTRASFSTVSPNNGWRAGQNVTVTSAQNDLSAVSFRIARVTTRFTKGTGLREYVCELGSVRASDSNNPLGVSGAGAGAALGQPGLSLGGALYAQGSVIFRAPNDPTDQASLTYTGAGDFFQIFTPGGGALTFDGTDGEVRVGLDVNEAVNGLTARLRLPGPLQFVCHTVNLPAASTEIPATSPNATSPVMRLNNTSGGPLTLTSTPTVADPPDSAGAMAQLIILYNRSTDNITLQDRGTLANSNLRLGAATRTLGTGDSITLLWAVNLSDWIEISFTNVL